MPNSIDLQPAARRLLTFGILSLVLAAVGSPAMSATAPGPQPSSAQRHNRILMTASSPCEDLIEQAAAGDEAGMDRSLAAIEKGEQAVLSTLDAASQADLRTLLTLVRAARKAGDDLRLALRSAETYRFLVDHLEDASLTVPKAVSLLDYSGFEIGILLRAENPDWEKLQGAVEEARGFWGSIEKRVRDRGLRDAMSTTMAGLEEGSRAHDRRLLAFAAKVDLDLVDLLEGYFEAAGGS